MSVIKYIIANPVYFFREVMTFRTEVQKSAEVGFAMDVFYALNSNNFVRFFRLLRYLFISA